MRAIDRSWPWQFLAAAIFIGGLAALRFMMKGINEDFGWGFGLGLMIGIFIALGAVGWRRGEHRSAADGPDFRSRQ